MKRIATLSLLLLVSVGSLVAQIPASKHVYIVAEENHSYEHLVGSSNMPYLNSLIAKGALATQFYANQHSSLPDYFWVTAGQPITSNNDTLLTYNVDNIVRHAMQLGLSYKSYAQTLPYAGYAGLYSGAYMKRHAPLPYFSDMGNSKTEMLKHVNISQLLADIQNNDLPNFAFITPDGNHDMHNCPNGEAACEQTADSFLKSYIAPLLARPEFQPGGDGVLIIWSDEADLSTDNRCSATVLSGCGGRILVSMIGPKVKVGYKSTTTYHHQNLLRTMLMAMGTTQNFPGASASAVPMTDMFNTTTTTASGTQISVAAPLNGSTVSTSMQVSATASGIKSITTMQVYVDNVLKASSNGSSINTTIAVSAGAHNVTVQSWDSTGAYTKKALTVTAVSGASVHGIVIVSPTAGTTVGSPVHVQATSNMANIVKTAVYVDNKLITSTASTSVNTYATMMAGTHSLVVQNWDSKGTVTKSAATFASK
ncbi:MAG TPA: alkaline phosphatase family protein [Candidatus Saccharimonadales bacterium]|nr:alkaline phosphatase family protein [Candidatus Saccharimonadales bacterium]